MALSNSQRREHLNALEDACDEVNLLWNLWLGLFDDDGRKWTLGGVAPDFFNTVQWVIADRLIVGITSLHDSSKGVLRFDKLVHDLRKEGADVTTLESNLDELDQSLGPLKRCRDEQIAHLSHKRLSGDLGPLSMPVDDVSKIVETLNTIVHGLLQAFEPSLAHSRYSPLHSAGGHKSILPALQDAERWRALHEWLYANRHDSKAPTFDLNDVLTKFCEFRDAEPRPSWLQDLPRQ